MDSTTEEKKYQSHLSWFLRAFADIPIIAVIIAVGWFLIGYYTRYEYLDTGYQDWIYHAFRIQDIVQYGIASWDHIWAGGLNHWRSFQYIEHLAAIVVVKYFGVSIPAAMMWLTASVYILIRILTYCILRSLGVGRVFSFFAVIISYATSQEWVAMKDYSIYISFLFIPIFLLIWIKAVDSNRYAYLVAAFSGASWSLHPVMGYSTFGLLLLLMLANNFKKDLRVLFLVTLVFFISLLPFSLPYLTSGYIITNIHSSSEKFLQQLLVPEYMGLSLIFYILMVISWILLIIKSTEIPRWAKLLLLYSTAYMVFIYFGLLGYYPSFVNKLQFSRAVPFIAFSLVFVFGAFLQAIFSNVRSRMFFSVIVVVIGISTTQSAEISSLHSGQPVRKLSGDPVSIYFADKELPKGSIYIKDVAWPSYFGKQGLRFITSYNRFPNPYPIRFNSLMKADISFTGITASQIKLISDYSLVLGVEYFFVPQLSPLVKGLTESGPNSNFVKEGEIRVSSEVYTVLRNTQPISLAYTFDSNEKDSLLRFADISKPSLQAASFKGWDEEISRFADIIRSEALHPVPVFFVWPDTLKVDLSHSNDITKSGIIVMQSFDNGWKVEGDSSGGIQPTNLRFMDVSLTSIQSDGELILKNSWPKWHWPVQFLGILMIVLSILAILARYLYERFFMKKTINVEL